MVEDMIGFLSSRRLPVAAAHHVHERRGPNRHRRAGISDLLSVPGGGGRVPGGRVQDDRSTATEPVPARRVGIQHVIWSAEAGSVDGGRAVVVATWWQRCGVGAIVAALPSTVWRVVVALGVPLGTPTSWRDVERLPGSGTWYVLGLSTIQLFAALATLVLIVPGGDRIPGWSPVAPGRRLPATVVVSISLLGALIVGVVCVASIVHWRRVDPFRDATAITAWSVLCWVCYIAAPAWPLLLAASSAGYGLARRAARAYAGRVTHQLTSTSPSGCRSSRTRRPIGYR